MADRSQSIQVLALDIILDMMFVDIFDIIKMGKLFGYSHINAVWPMMYTSQKFIRWEAIKIRQMNYKKQPLHVQADADYFARENEINNVIRF